MNYRPIYVLLLATCTAGCLAAQTSAPYSFNKIGFIENTDSQGSKSASAPYRTEINGLKVDFTSGGLRYSVFGQNRRRVKDKYAPNLDDGPTHETIEFAEDFSVFFVDPSDSLTIEALGQRSNYVVQHQRVKQKCYDRVMYRDVWPNIDIEFIMPDKGGIKYNIYLEPGADVDDIKLDYAAANALDLVDGNLHVYSGLGKWVEYAPVSFNHSQNIIESSYELNDGILSFNLPIKEITEPTVIDPWIALIPAITSYDDLPDPADSVFVGLVGEMVGTGLDNAYNRVQIDYDAVGNIYLSQIPCLFYTVDIGSDTYFAVGRFIHKYSPEGELLFTVDLGFEEVLCTDITVNKSTQDFYSMQQFSELIYHAVDGTVTDIFDIEALPDGNTEICSIQYDHCEDKLLLGLGGDFTETGRFIATTGSTFTGTLDYSLAYDISLSFPDALPYNDNIDVLIDPYGGDYYMLFLLRTFSGFLEDRALLKTDPVNVDPIWQVNGEFLYLTELSMHSKGVIQGNFGRNHYESLATSKSYIYGMNGSNLMQWDKADGSIVNDLEIYPFFQNSGRAEGIDVDLCGNVYVGAVNSIQVFDSLLNPLTTIPLAGMPQDIEIFGNKLYVAQDFNLQSIDIPESLSPWQITQLQPDSCNLCVGEASIQFCGESVALNNITVEWQGNGETGFSTSGLCAGWNQVKIFETKGCYTNTYVDSVFVEQVEAADCAFQVQLNDQSICSGECTTLAAAISGGIGPYTYLWEHDGTLETSSIQICPATTTTYTFTATDAADETISVSATVDVFPVPSLHLGNDTTLCPGEELLLTAEADGASILWQDGSTATFYQVSSAGAYWAEASIGECAVRDTVDVLYSLLAVNLGNDTTLCSFEGFELNAGAGPSGYTWQDGSNTQFFVVQEPGFYIVFVSDGICEASDNILVDVSQLQANFSFEDSTACDIQPIQFIDGATSGGSINSWSWNFGDGTFSSQQNPLHTFQQTGTYNVRLTVVDEFGCEATYSKTVVVNTFPGPEAFFSVDPATPNAFENVQFTDESQSAISWEWSFGDGNGSLSQNPLHSYTVPGRYPVELTVSNEYCTETVLRYINVGDELIVYVPNTFTPNGDGINDLFKAVVSGGDPAEFEMRIFSRWGEEVFYSEDYTEGWRGSFQTRSRGGGDEYFVPNGVYVWRIRVKENLSTERFEFSGHVTLIR